MARRFLAPISAGLAVLLTQFPAATLGGEAAMTHIDRAMRLLLTPAPTSQDLHHGFTSLLDALSEVARDAPSAAACRPKLAEARARIARASILDPQADLLILACYRDVHDGVTFRVPAGIRTMAEAVAYCRAELEAAKGLLRNGSGDKAFERLLDVTVMIVTPIERRPGNVASLIRLIGSRWWAAVYSWLWEGLGWLSTERSSSSG